MKDFESNNWKTIIYQKDNEIILYELNSNERLINRMKRNKKRTMLYEISKMKDNKKFTYEHKNIFSYEGYSMNQQQGMTERVPIEEEQEENKFNDMNLLTQEMFPNPMMNFQCPLNEILTVEEDNESILSNKWNEIDDIIFSPIKLE